MAENKFKVGDRVWVRYAKYAFIGFITKVNSSESPLKYQVLFDNLDMGECWCDEDTITLDSISLDEAICKTSEGAVKYDSEKIDLSLMPPLVIEEVGAVWTFGKKKYAAYNWTKGFVWSRPLAAALRHIFAFMRGEDRDPETGYLHTAHAICCLMMVVEFALTGTGTDDRYKSKRLDGQ
jgi:hypothetical protein